MLQLSAICLPLGTLAARSPPGLRHAPLAALNKNYTSGSPRRNRDKMSLPSERLLQCESLCPSRKRQAGVQVGPLSVADSVVPITPSAGPNLTQLRHAVRKDDAAQQLGRALAERELWNNKPRAHRPHCTLMLAARITLPHFSVSSAMSLPKSAGEPASTTPPNSASRALIVGSARAVLISLLSLSTISAAVFLGAPQSPAENRQS
jgi:hypothetical protein